MWGPERGDADGKMIVLWTCVLFAAASAHRVAESTEDTLPPATAPRTTTLLPVKSLNKTDSGAKQKTATSWKIETTFGESKLDSNSTGSNEELVLERPANSSQEFKPSQHLGKFVEEASFEIAPTKPTPDAFAGVIKKPPKGFISSPKDIKFPKEIFKNYDPFPYKIESPIITKAKDGWRPAVSSLESHPTDEAPVRVPAGGLYKLPHQDPFRIKPGTTGEDFGLEFSGGEGGDSKERPVKKRANPMTGLLHLLTALIPVGIIFSALTPSLITIEPDTPVHSNIFRRADGSFAAVPQISERCRRRLLCEIHSENNYGQSAPNKRNQHCHRIRCENPETLNQTLRWLLSQSTVNPHLGLRPTGLRPTATDLGLNKEHNFGVRPIDGIDNVLGPGKGPNGYIGHVKHRPNEGYGSYRPIDDDTGDHFNADFR